MKWKSRDHVSPQECSADKAGLPPNYTNLEKQIGAKLVSVHIPNYVLLYNLSAVIVWREKSSHLVVFFGGKVISTCVLPSSEACFWAIFQRFTRIYCQFYGRYLTVAEVSLTMTVRKFLQRWNELLLILSIWSVTMVHLVSCAIVMWFNFCSNSQPPLSQNTHAQKVMSHYTLTAPEANNAKSRHTLCLSTVPR